MANGVKGILGEKLGMTQIFGPNARIIPVTVIKAGPCTVTQVRTKEKDGYVAVQLAFGQIPARKVTKPQAGHFAKAGVPAARHLVELRMTDASGYSVGQEIRADVFSEGELADVIGVSKGKGFAGVMKRHGFAGAPASHGTDRKHRSPGSVGACATPARVFRGMKMGGHMGHERVTTLNLKVVGADSERNLLLVRGAVPGPDGGLVMVRSAVKAKLGRHA
ncbi:MAG: 50S ribosomal protein L3 [Actinomycetota bacterium]